MVPKSLRLVSLIALAVAGCHSEPEVSTAPPGIGPGASSQDTKDTPQTKRPLQVAD